jgi:hypothetical protein
VSWSRALSLVCVCEVALILACLSLWSLLFLFKSLEFEDYHDRPASHVPYPSPLRPSRPIGRDKGTYSPNGSPSAPGHISVLLPDNTVLFPLIRLGKARLRPRELESKFNEIVKEKVPED